MKLGEFTTETLNQIINGVESAQQYAITKGAQINPHDLFMEDNVLKMSKGIPSQHLYGQLVEFDIALATSEEKQSKGGAGVFVVPLTLGTSAKRTIQQRNKQSEILCVALLTNTKEELVRGWPFRVTMVQSLDEVGGRSEKSYTSYCLFVAIHPAARTRASIFEHSVVHSGEQPPTGCNWKFSSRNSQYQSAWRVHSRSTFPKQTGAMGERR